MITLWQRLRERKLVQWALADRKPPLVGDAEADDRDLQDPGAGLAEPRRERLVELDPPIAASFTPGRHSSPGRPPYGS